MKNLLSPAPAAEPLRSIGVTGSAVTAVITLLTAFGAHITPNQQVAIIGAVAVLGPLVVAEFGRRQVFSPATVKRMVGDTEPPTRWEMEQAATRWEPGGPVLPLPTVPTVRPASATQSGETTQEVPVATPAAAEPPTAAV